MPSINNVAVNNAKQDPRPMPNRDIVIDKLNAELAAGRILGPFTDSPIEGATYSCLYAVAKSTPGKFRLIHNLSKPNGFSVNDNIPDHLKSVQYCSVMQVAEFLEHANDGMDSTSPWYMAKVDLCDAYRNVPIRKEDWRYLGMTFEDKLFIDCCLPMGLGTSCNIFQSISDSLAWAFMNNNPEAKMFNYLDDFLILASSESLCKAALNSFIAMLNSLGLPLNDHKTVQPTTHVEFLGLGIDSSTLSFFVPTDKRLKISESITQFLSHKSHRVHSIQKLVGKLTFLCATFLPGKALLAGLHSSLGGILSSHGWAQRRINNSVRADLKVWLLFLAQTDGKPFKFIFPRPNVDDDIMYTDASGSFGFGGVFGTQWFQGSWSEGWWSEQNIALLELVPIYVGIVLNVDKISNTVLQLFTDNLSLVAMMHTFYSRDKAINNLLKNLALFTLNNNIVVKTSHICGKANVDADKLSRAIPGSSFLPENYSRLTVPSSLLSHIKSVATQ